MKFTTEVIAGQGRGRTLGYPTFNLQIPAAFRVKSGIYAGYVWLGGRQYLGAFHFGPIPVFADPAPHLEVFILDFSESITPSRFTFELVHYLRPIRNFANPAALSAQISRDVAKTRAVLN